VAEITNQMEYDDEVSFPAYQKLHDLSRQSNNKDRCPWCLTISFTHPHDPYVTRRQYWDLYDNCSQLDPEIGFIPYEEQDPHSKRLYLAGDYASFNITKEDVRRSRRSYFANISYIDDKIGEILSILERTRMSNNTIILFCSDHGDMLGEHGLWFKMSFFKGSSRVPLMIAGRGIKPTRINHPDFQSRRLPNYMRPCQNRHFCNHSMDQWTIIETNDSRG